MSDYIKLHALDNVGVLITPREGIPAGHKIALTDIAKGKKVIKYGCPIGTAQSDIKEGEWIHSHNLKTALSGEKDYTYAPQPIHRAAPFQGSFTAAASWARTTPAPGTCSAPWPAIPTQAAC